MRLGLLLTPLCACTLALPFVAEFQWPTATLSAAQVEAANRVLEIDGLSVPTLSTPLTADESTSARSAPLAPSTPHAPPEALSAPAVTQHPNFPLQQLRIWVTQGFQPRERAALFDAARAWETATLGAVTMETGEGNAPDDSCYLCVIVVPVKRDEMVREGKTEAVALTSFRGDRGMRIRIAVDWVRQQRAFGDDPLPSIARHEFGHTLGLDHDAPGTVMSEYTDTSARRITCRDTQRWQAVNAPTLPRDALCSLDRKPPRQRAPAKQRQ